MHAGSFEAKQLMFRHQMSQWAGPEGRMESTMTGMKCGRYSVDILSNRYLSLMALFFNRKNTCSVIINGHMPLNSNQ